MSEDKHDDVPDDALTRDLGKTSPSTDDDHTTPGDDEYGAVDPDFESDHLIFEAEDDED